MEEINCNADGCHVTGVLIELHCSYFCEDAVLLYDAAQSLGASLGRRGKAENGGRRERNE